MVIRCGTILAFESKCIHIYSIAYLPVRLNNNNNSSLLTNKVDKRCNQDLQ
jgi:hypothetical protein